MSQQDSNPSAPTGVRRKLKLIASFAKQQDFLRDFGANPYDEPSVVERLGALADSEMAERVQNYEDGKSAEVKTACMKAEIDAEYERLKRDSTS